MKNLYIALVLIFLVPIVAHADVVQENFNELSVASATTSAGVFTATSGNVDIVGPGYYGYLCAAPESGNCVDMDGNVPGSITTSNLTLTPGTYLLSFDLIGSQRGDTTSTTVTLGSLYDQTFVLSSTDDTSGVVSVLLTVSATTIAPLVFTSNDPPTSASGALLDNVDLKQISSVPEPATLSLVAAGLAGFVIRRKRALGAR